MWLDRIAGVLGTQAAETGCSEVVLRHGLSNTRSPISRYGTESSFFLFLASCFLSCHPVFLFSQPRNSFRFASFRVLCCLLYRVRSVTGGVFGGRAARCSSKGRNIGFRSWRFVQCLPPAVFSRQDESEDHIPSSRSTSPSGRTEMAAGERIRAA